MDWIVKLGFATFTSLDCEVVNKRNCPDGTNKVSFDVAQMDERA